MGTIVISKRPWGTGSVHQDRGKWRSRLPGKYGRRNLDGHYDTRDEAEAALAAALEMLVDAPLEAPTLASFGETWLSDTGGRDVRKSVLERDRLRWSAYIEEHSIATKPIVEVTEYDVEKWLGSLRGTRRPKLAAQTKQNALSLLRQALEAARERGGPLHGRPNPAAEVTLGKRERERTSERWSWLRAAQVETVLGASGIPVRSRVIFATAIYTGMRAGEMWGLRWEDVDLERGILSVGRSRGEATKTGRPREVPMLAPVREALRQWRVLYTAAGIRSRHGLVWPSTHGGYHAEGYDAGWSKIADELGLGHATFHDLRHTCASHLLMGTWAPALLERALRLEEVQKWLGHTTIATTSRYAHLAPEAIAGLVSKPQQRDTGRDTDSSHFGELNPGPTVYECVAGTPFSIAKAVDSGDASWVVSRLRRASERAADAIYRGDPHRDHRALDLIEAATEVCEALSEAEHSPDVGNMVARSARGGE